MANLAASIFDSILQYHISRRMLDAQKDMHQRIIFFAEKNREMSAELFASHLALRAWDQRVYDEVLGIDCEDVCENNIDRGMATGHFVPERVLQDVVFRHSRYNAGTRSADIRDALALAAPAASSGMTVAANHEDLLKEACESFRWTSIAQTSAGGGFNPAPAFGAIGNTLKSLHDVYQAQATGSTAALGGAVTRTVVYAKEALNKPQAAQPAIINQSLADKRLGL